MIVKLKYISMGALVLIVVLFYFINEKNKASAERIKQAEIERVQRLEQNKIDEEQAKKSLEAQRIQSEKARALKAEQDKLNSQKQAKEFEQKSQTHPGNSGAQGNKYSEEEWLSICKSTAGGAKAIMSSRQRGAAMPEMMDKVVRPADPAIKDIIKAFVIDAYNRPRYDTLEYQQKAILDFENYAYLTCIKVRQ